MGICADRQRSRARAERSLGPRSASDRVHLCVVRVRGHVFVRVRVGQRESGAVRVCACARVRVCARARLSAW